MVGAILAGLICAGNEVTQGVSIAFGVIAAAMVLRIAGAFGRWVDGE